jgi:peptidoglycan/xylan/chitin deacetylase (PgdA/CDA1 family)
VPLGGSGQRILAAGPQLAAGAQLKVGGAAQRMSEVPRSGVAPGDKVVALTFDDGPDPTYTPQVLGVLKDLQVAATFFMIGWEADASPDLVRQTAAAGDGIGNHTWNHADLTRLGDAGFRAQVDRTNELLGSLTGRRISCVRPPEGHVSKDAVRRLASRGLTAVLWSDDPRDWTRPGTSAIVQRVLAQAAPGAIIELHDGGGDRSETVQALPAIVEDLQAQGYRLAPICL